MGHPVGKDLKISRNKWTKNYLVDDGNKEAGTLLIRIRRVVELNKNFSVLLSLVLQTTTRHNYNSNNNTQDAGQLHTHQHIKRWKVQQNKLFSAKDSVKL